MSLWSSMGDSRERPTAEALTPISDWKCIRNIAILRVIRKAQRNNYIPTNVASTIKICNAGFQLVLWALLLQADRFEEKWADLIYRPARATYFYIDRIKKTHPSCRMHVDAIVLVEYLCNSIIVISLRFQ